MKGDMELIICRCEEITLGEILQAIEAGCRSVKSVKRHTRAGMGACQGRTCGRMIAAIIAERTGVSKEALGPDHARFPSVPLSLEAIGTIGAAGNLTPGTTGNGKESV
jgi:sarcosine oxidase, subunit beta